MKRYSTIILAAGALAALASPSGAAILSLSPDADTYLRDATPRGNYEYMDVRGGAVDFRGYLRFDLSSIPAGATIDSATLDLFQVAGASRNDTILPERLALYGLNNEAGNTPQNWDEATFTPGAKGTENVATLTGVTDLDGDVPGITETIGSNLSVSGIPLVDFLSARLADGGLTTFILSNDDATDRGFGIGTKEGDLASVPVLTIGYTAVPEPTSLVLLALALGGLSLARYRC